MTEKLFDSDQAALLDRADSIVALAKKNGADAVDAVVTQGVSLECSVRDGKLESSERSESAGLNLRVFLGKKTASVSADLTEDADEIVERALAMAKVVPEDVHQGHPDRDLLQRAHIDLDLFDATDVSSDDLKESALACEAAMRSVDGVSKSGGAGASYGTGGFALVTSEGFSGGYKTSSHSLYASAIAGEGTDMQTDYEVTGAIHKTDLTSPDVVGREAGERTVKLLDPRKVESQSVPLIFDRRVAHGFVGSLTGAINGASIARKTSFLSESLETQIFPKTIQISDNPLKMRSIGSSPFDGEGVARHALNLVDEGVLQCWLLDTATGNELGMKTNGRASRSGAGTRPGSTHVTMSSGEKSPEEMMNDIGTGLYVTGLIGHGVNMITGDYSRGAVGLWFENGEFAYPVNEITIAGNLKDMFMQMTPCNDSVTRFSTTGPSVVIDGMMIAGL